MRMPQIKNTNVTLRSSNRYFSSTGYFDIKKVDGGVALVTLDDKSSKVNTLSSSMMKDFTSMLSTVEADPQIEAVVFLSGKKDSFIAGADINELANVKTAADGESLSKNGQDNLGLLSKSNKSFIAAINGSCMGGGLEFALACDYRIATSNKKTMMSLPEVQLGLLPGAGGTQRLPKLIGLQKALTLMTTGKPSNATQAKRLGLVDEVADPFALEGAAIDAAKRLIQERKSNKKRKAKKSNLMETVLEKNPLGRYVLFDQAQKMAAKQTLGNYPAVPMIIDCVKEGAEKGMEAGLALERKNFGKLTVTSESTALKGLYFGSTNLKKNRFETPELKEKYKNLKPTVGVLGAGLMGAGIAQVSAETGCNVVLKDLKLDFCKRGETQIQSNLEAKEKRKRMTKNEKDVIMSKIDVFAEEFHPQDMINSKLANCDYVVEAVLEELSLKHKVLGDLEKITKPDCVLATNTSALRLSDIASKLTRKQNLIGMHYFSPVDKMQLLEIIPYDETSQETKFKALKLGIQQKKTCIVVKDVPGFFVNRCLGPYLSEVTEILKEGVDVKDLDKYMKQYGFPVGPISLVDEVGMDVALHVQHSLSADIGARMSDATILEKLRDKGNLGRKSGKGFFTYPKGKNKTKEVTAEAKAVIESLKKPGSTGGEKDKVNVKELQERMAFKFINEALLCLQDGIIESVEDGDIGSVFGVGFPPFRGGPFREVDHMGAQVFVDKMNAFAAKYGERFTPAQIVQDYAKQNKKFY